MCGIIFFVEAFKVGNSVIVHYSGTVGNGLSGDWSSDVCSSDLTVLFINFIVFYPLEIQGAIQKEALLDLLMKAFRTGLIGSIISTFGGSCGILWDSAYMAYGIPFVSFYFGIILHDRYFKNQIWFYPVEWILADENWGPDKIGVWLFLLLFLLVMLGILGGVLYGRLEEI